MKKLITLAEAEKHLGIKKMWLFVERGRLGIKVRYRESDGVACLRMSDVLKMEKSRESRGLPRRGQKRPESETKADSNKTRDS